MARTQPVTRLMMDADGTVVVLRCEQKCPSALVIEHGGHLMTVGNIGVVTVLFCRLQLYLGWINEYMIFCLHYQDLRKEPTVYVCYLLPHVVSLTPPLVPVLSRVLKVVDARGVILRHTTSTVVSK